MSKPISLIVACTPDGGIGNDDKMPWNIPREMRKFKTITKRVNDANKINAVIMGRDTWESMDRNPLPGRLNIILTRNRYYKVPNHIKEGAAKILVAHSIHDALVYCNEEYIENVFIIGGAMLYNTFLESGYYFSMIDKIYLSVIFYDHNIITNKYIDMDSIFINFKIHKDYEFDDESRHRLFASYICIPKKKFRLPEELYKRGDL